MKKVVYSLVLVMLMVGLLVGCAAPAPAPAPIPTPAPAPAPAPKPEVVTFKAVAFLPAKDMDVRGFTIFINKVNVKFKDYLKIDLLGGPEVTPPFQLHEAVKSGVIDMCLTSCSYYPSLVWEAQAGMYTNWEISGTPKYPAYFELMSKLHENAGLVWLDSANLNQTFHMFVNKKLDTPWDAAGLKLRVFPAFIPLAEALEAVPINLPMGDIYTAMQRGTVDGFFMTHFGAVTDFSWQEVTKYVVDYPLYKGTCYILVNPKSWNKLPANIRKEIIDFKIKEVDPASAQFYGQETEQKWTMMTTLNFVPPYVVRTPIKPIKFSPSDGEAFMKLAYDSAWKYVIAKSPDIGPKLKELLVK